MSTETDTMRAEADRLCSDADRRDGGEAWPLYSRAGRLRDAAHLLDEAVGYRRLARQVSDPDERARFRSLARTAERSVSVRRVSGDVDTAREA